MARCAPDHCVLKNDAVRANLDRATFRHETRAKHNPAMRANRNVTAHGRGWGDVSRRVNSRFLSPVGENHDWWPNDPSSATRPTRAFDCNRSAMAGFAA